MVDSFPLETFTNLVDLLAGTADARDIWRLHIRRHSRVDPAPVYFCSLVGGGQGDSRQSAFLLQVQTLYFFCYFLFTGEEEEVGPDSW